MRTPADHPCGHSPLTLPCSGPRSSRRQQDVRGRSRRGGAGSVQGWAATAALIAGLATPAHAADEIQVYNAGIAATGQFTIEQHLNYTPLGLKEPPFPGGFPSNHALNGTPEFAYGVTEWWELGLYLPFAVQNDQFLSNAFKVRSLFVAPHADQRSFFYGVNFELSNPTPPFCQCRWALETRPIIGVRNAEWEFIVNPIVDSSFGRFGEVDFLPAARLARKLDKELSIGFEYYSDLGEFGHFGKVAEQQHNLFAVTDFKVGEIDVNFGVGYGLTPASDRWIVKGILGYAFPVPGGGEATEQRQTLVNPMSRSAMRLNQP